MAEYIVSRDNKQYKFLKKLKDKKYRDQNILKISIIFQNMIMC